MAEKQQSDSDDEKTEEPSQQRLEDFRKEGQVAQSKELTSLFVLLATLGVMYGMGPSLASGFMDFMRESKLSTSTSRNLRSATGGSGSLGLPDRSDNTPITKGSCTFFSAPYSSTSYSIWTRGARFLAMNFWLLVAMVFSLR